MNKLINIKVPVLHALDDMGIDHGKNIPDFIRWAATAENEIGSARSLKKQIVVLTVDKYRAELPCGAKYVQRVLLGDYGCNCYDLFDYLCQFSRSISFKQTDTFLVVDNPGGGRDVSICPVSWDVQDNHIILNGNYDKQKITIQYLGLQTDEEGFPLVCENHVEAIIEYIMYRYAKRSRFTANKMDASDVNTFMKLWGTLAAEARAVDEELSESDRDAVSRMLNDPISGGYGMEVNMHNRNELGNSMWSTNTI
jgi:hypothetical protein